MSGATILPSQASSAPDKDELVVSLSFSALRDLGWTIINLPRDGDGDGVSSPIQDSEDCLEESSSCVGLGLSTHRGGAVFKREVSRTDSTSSGGLSIISDIQDTNSQPTDQVMSFKRKCFLNHLISKKTDSEICSMSVNIPSFVSKRRNACAKLTVTISPYVEESSLWPSRYSYLSLFLSVPPQYITTMTVVYCCKLIFSLHVTTSKPSGTENMLLENEAPLSVVMDVPMGESECSVEGVKLIQHTKLIDTLCEKIILHATAKFELHPRHSDVPDYPITEGFVDIDAPPMDVTTPPSTPVGTPPSTPDMATPPSTPDMATPPSTPVGTPPSTPV